MAPHVLGCEEPPVTIITRKLFIRFTFNSSTPGVNFQVIHYLLPRAECLITDLTLQVAFLGRVQSCMLPVAELRCIRLPAVRSLASVQILHRIMYPDVIRQMILAIERLPASGAREGAGLAVNKAVAHQLEFGVESLVAEVAREGQLAGVAEHVLAQLPGAGESLLAGGADVALTAIATRPALRLRRPRPLGPCLERRYPSHGLHRAETLLDPAGARGVHGHVLHLGGQLRRGRSYEPLLRGGRARPARLLRELGAALRAFSRVRWRTGHLAHIFDALALYRRSVIARSARAGSAVPLARRDGRKHFCHIDGLEALFRIRVTWFSRNFWSSSSVSAELCRVLVSLRFYSIEESGEGVKNDEKSTFFKEIRSG